MEVFVMNRICVVWPDQPCMPLPQGESWTYLLSKFVCLELDQSRNLFGKHFRTLLNMFIEDHPAVATITNENYQLVITVKTQVSEDQADGLARDMLVYFRSFEEEKTRLLTGKIIGKPPERLEQAHGN